MITVKKEFPVVIRNDAIPPVQLGDIGVDERHLKDIALMIETAGKQNTKEHIFYVAHVHDDVRVIYSVLRELERLRGENAWLKQRS
jgi:hypothetical protein